MLRYRLFEGETIRCSNCDLDFMDAREYLWCCPNCEERLLIYVQFSDGRKRVFYRISAKAITVSHSVCLSDPDSSYPVLDNRKNNSKQHIALKGYGVYKAYSDEYLNCIAGSW